MFLELANAVALLLALSLLQAFNVRYLHRHRFAQQIISGLLFGGICVVGMMNPITVAPGAIFDPRSVILSLCGMYGGTLAAAVAALIAGSFRVWLGGVGAVIGVSVIVMSTVAGLIFRYLRDSGRVKAGPIQLLVFGLIVHAITVGAFTLFPKAIARDVIDQMALPFLMIFGPATALLGLLLQDIQDRLNTEADLSASEARYARVMEGADQGFWDWNLKTQEFRVSPRFETMLGYEPGEMQLLAGLSSERWRQYVHPQDYVDVQVQVERHLKGETTTFEMEVRWRTKSGQWRWMLARGRVVARDDVGNPLIMSGTHTDVTASHEAEMALQASEQNFRLQSRRLEEVLWGTDAGTWEWNLSSDEAVLNARFAEMLGYTLVELAQLCGGRLTRSGISQLVDAEGLRHANEQMQRYFQDETDLFTCEVKMRRKDGQWIWIQARGRIVEWTDDGQPLRMSGIHLDIDARKQSEEKLQYIAHYDLLTGLPNRVLLADRLQQAMAQCVRRDRMLAVAYLDLDGFKEINDRFGHDAGDDFLVALARRLQATMRDADTLARIGGDEFAAVLVDLTHPQDCHAGIARLLQAAAEHVSIGDITVHVSASIGITIYPQDGSDADQLLRHADQAMYLAKQAGKNRYHLFDPELAASVERQRENLERIRQALVQREFVLHYQPKVNMKTGELLGVEALVRWQHPEQGLRSPGTFLPAIENDPLCVALGDWVIEEALTQMTAWQSEGLDIPVSINVGPRQLQQPNFASRLSEMLAAHPSVRPQDLELEILETSALADIQNISEVMQVCRRIGVRFALDDFGTGYSSLTYLRRLPADVLKIDQTFVRDILDDVDDLAIVRGVLGLANAFRRMAIAEGVETIAHGELLITLGCEFAQGYAIARPMPAQAIPEWLATWQPDPSWRGYGRPSSRP